MILSKHTSPKTRSLIIIEIWTESSIFVVLLLLPGKSIFQDIFLGSRIFSLFWLCQVVGEGLTAYLWRTFFCWFYRQTQNEEPACVANKPHWFLFIGGPRFWMLFNNYSTYCVAIAKLISLKFFIETISFDRNIYFEHFVPGLSRK